MALQSKHDLSADDLEDLIREFLAIRGASPEYVAGYIDAQRRAGYLRPNCPAWIRNSAGIWYAIPHANTPDKL